MCNNYKILPKQKFDLLKGTTDIEQLALVIRTLGTPRLTEWPDLTSLPDYNKIRYNQF